MDPLLQHASRVDTIDAILGVSASLCYFSGSDTLTAVGMGLNALDIVANKLPFARTYVKETQDFRALMYWLPKEILASSSPLGGLLDIVPTYRMRTYYTLNR